MSLLRWPTMVVAGLVAAVALFLVSSWSDEGKASSVPFEEQLPTFDAILAEWQPQMGQSFAGYRNHCYRVFHFTKALYPSPLTPVQREQLQIALAFHDLGIWSDPLPDGRNSIDYIDPSVKRAREYLTREHKPAEWNDTVSLLISEHHKLTVYADPTQPESRLIETMRLADSVDFTLGFARAGLSRALVASVRDHWANAGFHAGLAALAWGELNAHPLNPFPMMKL